MTILTQTEIDTLTKKVKYSAQARELNSLGIPFRRRRDGSLVVYEGDLHAPQKKGSASSKLRLPEIR